MWPAVRATRRRGTIPVVPVLPVPPPGNATRRSAVPGSRRGSLPRVASAAMAAEPQGDSAKGSRRDGRASSSSQWDHRTQARWKEDGRLVDLNDGRSVEGIQSAAIVMGVVGWLIFDTRLEGLVAMSYMNV